MFCEASSRLQDMAILLHDIVRETDEDDILNKTGQMSAMKQATDETARKVLKSLARHFITPIDREDIHYLISALDHASDQMYAASRSLGWNDQGTGHAIKLHMCKQLLIAARTCHALMTDLGKPNRPHSFKHIDELHAIGREMSLAFDKGMEQLYLHENDFKAFFRRREVYLELKETMERFRDIAHVSENIILCNVG